MQRSVDSTEGPGNGAVAPERGISFRSIVIGLMLVPANVLWVVMAEVGWYSGFPTCVSLFYNAVISLLVLIVGNIAVRRYRAGWALTPGELVVIFTIVSIASGIAGHDTLQILIPTMMHGPQQHHMAGQYSEVLPHVPEWLIVTDREALTNAYMGQESVFAWHNISPWLRPLAWWFAFVLALCAVMGGLNLLFRKQWTEQEKLAYPVIRLPFALATAPGELFRSKVFWGGFAVSGFVGMLNGLNVLYPLLPSMPVAEVVNIQAFFPNRPWSDMGPMLVSLYPFAIGMFFFIPLDLAFSTWFFFFVFKAQRILASNYGLLVIPGAPFVTEQMGGAYYGIALIALWMGRRNLFRIGCVLAGRSPEGTTAWERREAWLAVVLMTAGFGFLLYFSHLAGMTLWIAGLFFIMFYLVSIAITRLRVEVGSPVHDLYQFGPHFQLTRMLGLPRMIESYPRDLGMFGLYNFFVRTPRGHVMPHAMEGFRMGHMLGLSHGRYLLAQGLAVMAGAFFGFWALLWMYYRYGAWSGVAMGDALGWEAWHFANVWFTSPEPHRLYATFATLFGTLVCLGLSALRMNLGSWPFHPVGFALAGTWSMDRLWFCAFLAWSIKAALLRFGGGGAYRQAVPFFLGLILGDFVVGGGWNLYGILTETQVYRFWY